MGTGAASPSAYDDSAWFRRFRFPHDDLDEVHADVVSLRSALERGSLPPAEELETRIELGSMLFPLGHESEADQVLVPAVGLAHSLADDAHLVAALLHLATTRQYLGRRQEALALFEDGLAQVRATGEDAHEHYLLHHRGRCHAEIGDREAARSSFERALDLRRALGVPWMVASTQGALDELDAWCGAHGFSDEGTATPDPV